MIRVVDDFLNAAYYKGLENTVLTSFNWGFNVSISGYDVLEDSGLFGFSHSIFDAGISASPFYQFLIPFLLQSSEAAGAKILLRARGDMTVNTGKRITYEPHIDMPAHREHINIVYFVGDSDGDTILYKEKFDPVTPETYTKTSLYKVPETLTEKQRISPKANRAVIFSGEYWHTGQSPINHTRRVILNLNYADEDYRMNK